MTVSVELTDGTLVMLIYALQTLILLATYLVIRSRLTVVAGVIVELGRKFGGGVGGGGGSGSWKTIAAQAVAPMLPQLLSDLMGGGRGARPPNP